MVPGDSLDVIRTSKAVLGIQVCWEAHFPEISCTYALKGADILLMPFASGLGGERRRSSWDRILPARALEDVTYTAFINNVGDMDGLTMHGCSRGLDPFGETLASCGTSEGAVTFTVDDDVLEKARETRRHLSDFRSDVDWRIQRF